MSPCRGTGQQWPATGVGTLGVADLVWHKPSWRRLPFPTTEPPEFTQDWGNTLLEGTNKTLCTRTQKKGAVTQQEADPDWPVSVQESQSGCGLAVACCRVGALSVCMDLLKEVAIIFITSIIVWPQVKQQGGNTALPINRKLDLKFTKHGATHQNKTQFPLILSLPSGSFHKPLTLLHQRANRLKTTITEN